MAFDSAENRLNKIVDTLKNNNFLHRTTILTGSNGSGKSFIRKVIWQRVQQEMEEAGIKEIKPQHLVASVSMERRTSSDLFNATMNAFTHDASWNPTSLETFNFVSGLLEQDERYLVIDEPEIGMAEEMQLLLCKVINEKLMSMNSYGVLVITHSRTIVNNLMHDQFINMDCMTEEQWVNRVPQVPDFDLEEFSKASHELYLEINKVTKKTKE